MSIENLVSSKTSSLGITSCIGAVIAYLLFFNSFVSCKDLNLILLFEEFKSKSGDNFSYKINVGFITVLFDSNPVHVKCRLF